LLRYLQRWALRLHFFQNQNGIAKAITATNAVIEVKRSSHKGTPPGWHHGRKVGWDGRGRPPGQAKRIAARDLSRVESIEEPALALFGTAMRE
jgi:hypothetical protein